MGHPTETGRFGNQDIEREIAENRFERGISVVDKNIRTLFENGGAVTRSGDLYFFHQLDIDNLPPELGKR